MPFTNWTLEDLVTFTMQAQEMDTIYCEHCQVVPTHVDEKYCGGCAQEITDLLAARYTEQGLMERGLY